MKEQTFEEQLRSALLDANREEWSELLRETPAVEPSPRYLRWRTNFLADPFKYETKHGRPRWRRATRVLLCAVLAVLLTFGAVLAVSPAARQWVMQWFETHTLFTFQSSGDEYYRTPGHWYPDYLPEGFYFLSEENLDNYVKLQYENEDKITIRLHYTLQKAAFFYSDNEHQFYEELFFSDGTVVSLLKATADNEYNYLIWNSATEQTAFMLFSTYDFEELFKVAESVHQKIKN